MSKKYKIKKHFTTKKAPNFLDDIANADFSDPAVLDVIMQSQEFVQMFPQAKKEYVNQQNAESLNCILGEFFDAFIVIGLDLRGDGHYIKNYRTFQQKAVMRVLLENLLVDEDHGIETSDDDD